SLWCKHNRPAVYRRPLALDRHPSCHHCGTVVWWLLVACCRRRAMPPIPVLNIASPEFKANPIPAYARLRSEAPVYRTILPDKQSAWLITRYEDVLAVLKD